LYAFLALVSLLTLVSLCSIKLTSYDIVKRIIAASEKEYQTITEENRNKQKNINKQ
jgi:hypothetical protein